jgi:hypothetical protein
MGEMEHSANTGGAEVDLRGDVLVRNAADVDARPSMADRMKRGVAEDDDASSNDGKSSSVGIADSRSKSI